MGVVEDVKLLQRALVLEVGEAVLPGLVDLLVLGVVL
jgi:hypothetical protein